MMISASDRKRGYTALLASFVVLVAASWALRAGALLDVASRAYIPAIVLSYVAIAASLALLVYRERHIIPRVRIFIAVGIAVLASGFTHATDAVVMWKPLYWLSSDVKLITALASLTCALVFPFLIPKIGGLLEAANRSEQNARRFKAASDSSNDGFSILESKRDAAGEIVDFSIGYVNARGAAIARNTPQELYGQTVLRRSPFLVTSGLFEKFKQVVATGDGFEEEFAVRSDTIDASWLRIQVVKLEDGVAITTIDVSARKENELKLARMANFTRSIIASSPFATIVTDLTGTITSVNPAAERILRYSKERLVGRETPLVLLDPKDVAERAGALGRELGITIEPGFIVFMANLDRNAAEPSEWQILRADGSRFDAQLTTSALITEEGETVGLVMIFYDVSERKRTEERMSHLAHHDALTGLPTRALFGDRLNVALARANRNVRKVGVLMLDIDKFQRVNDLMGHQVGDELLARIADRLQSFVRNSDTVARIGGDEFAIVLDDLHSVDEAEAIAKNC
ncbi:MAG: diguanylate cyclase [Candidatus Eremiobacteraeota bacterium]|nr:diguanylate cyclase [Candidatus Eremiobacteraeota bacterium]